MAAEQTFKLTYATMFNPPEELHTRFEAALQQVKDGLGREHGMLIGGKDVFSAEKFEDRSPADQDLLLGVFQMGSAEDAQAALAAARKAFPAWSRTRWQERVALVRRAAGHMESRLFEMGAVMALEVGKNRLESLGDVAETIELLRYACQQMEENDGYVLEMERDPLPGFQVTNLSVMRPYGVWVVISPFNFPAALTGGPLSAALVTGNTVVFKPASDTPWIPRLIAECLREAGIPDGVFNYVSGSGSGIGRALVTCADVDGLTFTGSYAVGIGLYRDFAACRWNRPILLEMGGKNAAVVSRHADLDAAASGIVRSAFGLQGQKCSACSRVLIEEGVYDALVERLVEATRGLKVGDPTGRKTYLGPVINRNAYRQYQEFCAELQHDARILCGGTVLNSEGLDRGFFCAPTLAVDLPLEHRLWQEEMFVPVTTLARVRNLDEAMKIANGVEYGLTAGFYGSREETEWFFERIEAGVCYANRPQGATTGAWPGYQPFGGWKSSGATGKNAGGVYYLPQYLREQIQTRVRKL